MPSLNRCWGLPGNTSSPSKCSCEPPFRHKGSSVPGVGGGGGGGRFGGRGFEGASLQTTGTGAAA